MKFRGMRKLVGLALGLSTVAAQAAIITVTGAGDIAAGASLDTTASCSFNSCATLREAINAGRLDDIIRFAPALDGATILLTRYTNCLATTDPLSATCFPGGLWPFVPGTFNTPFVDQFGPSAFFISGFVAYRHQHAQSLAAPLIGCQRNFDSSHHTFC